MTISPLTMPSHSRAHGATDTLHSNEPSPCRQLRRVRKAQLQHIFLAATATTRMCRCRISPLRTFQWVRPPGWRAQYPTVGTGRVEERKVEPHRLRPGVQRLLAVRLKVRAIRRINGRRQRRGMRAEASHRGEESMRAECARALLQVGECPAAQPL